MKISKIHYKLWNGNAPSENGLTGEEVYDPLSPLEITNVHTAELYVYLPPSDINTRKAVVICPGGAYAGLAINSQGHDFAEWLCSLGIAGIVLKYRLPNQNKNIPLDDLKETFEYLHQNAAKFNIDKNDIGVCGFSAGGHLAALFANSKIEQKHSYLHPAFNLLFYPVISMQNYTHELSKENLLGTNPSAEELKKYSPDLLTGNHTPQTLILCSDDDTLVSPINSILYYRALQENKIPASLHLFPSGNHAWNIKGTNMFGQKFEQINQAKIILKDWLSALKSIR